MKSVHDPRPRLRPRALLAVLILLCCFGTAAVFAVGGWQPQGTAARADAAELARLRKKADKFFTEKSFALALDGYKKWLDGAPSGYRDRTEVEYRYAVSLGKAQKWDAASAAIEAFLKAHGADPLWRGRGHYWRAQLLALMPDQGYRVGGTLYRGQDYPKTDSAERPEVVWLGEEDRQQTVKSLETALKAFESLSGPARRSVAQEEIDLHLDAARFLAQAKVWSAGNATVEEAKKVDWKINPAAAYDPSWPTPKKVLFLFARAPRLKPGDADTYVNAELYRAVYLAASQPGWVWYGSPPKREVIYKLPYCDLDPIAIVSAAAAKYPRHAQAPQLRLLAAQWTAQTGELVEAVALLRALIDRYGESKWAPDARLALQNILRRVVNVGVPGPLPATGAPAKVTVSTANLKSVTLRAYRVDLDAVLLADTPLNDPTIGFGALERNFGPIKSAREKGKLIAEWTLKTADKGDHKGVSATVETPLKEVGAYLVEASGGDDAVRAATLVLITDLAVVRKTDRDENLCYVVDAATGRPVPGAKVVVKEVYHEGNTAKVDIRRGMADESGLCALPRVAGRSAYSQRIEAFAYAPGERYALTDRNGWWGYDNGEREKVKAYGYTDRPVYRPKQTVHFRQILAERAAGSDFKPYAGRLVSVFANSPKGDVIFKAELTTNEFGSISGKFDLPGGAPLGQYNVAVFEGPNQQQHLGSFPFRVEEYKKPEFEVKVAPSAEQARFGDTVTATVNATYYYGAPVANAKVTYKVFRTPYYPYFRFPRPYDWFYDQGQRDPYYQRGQGELVKSGEAVTDAKGDAKVSFVAERPKGQGGYQGDYSYRVEAEVTDPSRRVIEGMGLLKVTQRGFYAFLDVKQGFYLAGDTAQVEIRTQDANENPVAAKGELAVFKLTYDAQGKETAAKVHTQPVETDKDGKALTTWKADEPGQYRTTFTALDKWEQEVTGSAALWVGADGIKGNVFRAAGVTLFTDKTTYEEGESARVLIVCDQPNDYLLLTQETGAQIMERKLVHVPGRTRVIEVPIVRAHVPNFALAAVCVRDYQFYRWSQELFVPPSRNFAKMTVTSDKADYRPGEKGVFKVKATDESGNPVAAEVSLSVVDASVFYIQSDYTPDIRLAYYGERRYVNVQADGSGDFRVAPRTESDDPWKEYKPHGIVLPEVGRIVGLTGHGTVYRYRGLRDLSASNGPGGRVDFFAADGAMANGMGGFGGGLAASAPAPRLAAPQSEMASMEKKSERRQEGGEAAPTRVRSNFADTAFWTPAVVTDRTTGEATIAVTFPDTLTTWKTTARGLTAAVKVGAADTQVVTDKNLLVRLAAPRFFVERDRVTLSAIVRNDLKTEKRVTVRMETDPTLLAMDTAPLPEGRGTDGHAASFGKSSTAKGAFVAEVRIPAGTEKRVDFPATVKGEGNATVRVFAETDEESDAAELSFPVLAYGVQKFVMQSGVLKEDQSKATLTVEVPKDHRKGTAALLVQVNPSLAATTLDALPYLADYPYGCVEQTMSRFLPSVLVAKALKDSGVQLETLRKRAEEMRRREAEGTPFGQEKPTDVHTDQTGYTYPTGTPGVMKTPLLAENLYHTDRWHNPVFDEGRLNEMTAEGLSRLVSMQRPDGGWGWWSGSATADSYMTGYVVYGLATAKAAGVAVPDDVLARGFAWLERDIQQNDDKRDIAMWEAFALSLRGGKLSADVDKIVTSVYATRDRLSPYGQALLALTLGNTGRAEEAKTVCRNLVNTATIDRENGTASWRTHDRWWWHWYNNDAETVAWVLKAFVAVQPDSDLNPMLVKWLVNHKRGNAWRSTKETAMAVYALTDYLRQSNELGADYKLTVALGNKISRTFTVNPTNALLFDNRFLVPSDLLPGGTETVTLTKEGKGRVYYSAAVQYVSTEEKIKGTGTELQVARRYYRLTPKAKSQKDWRGEYNTLDYDRAPLADGAALKSGDLIEVEMVLESKNDYQYVIFEDMKPAGCEPVDRRSGTAYGDGLCSNMELRDTKTAFFVDRLPQGRRVLRYRLRAEVPGAFHALPTNAYAMYATDVRALSDSWTVSVTD